MFEKKKLNDKIFIGVVENVYDEERKGRIQVRVQTVFNQIELEHIPWAEPQRNLDGKSFCVPAVGKIVNVVFVNGNVYEPQYIYSENYNTNLLQKLNDMDDAEYENFVALLMDHRTQIYSDDTGICLDYSQNRIMIGATDIDIHLKDNDQLLHLGHEDADQSAMLGDHFLEWMDGFMETLLQPSSLIGNIGAPVLKPTVDSEIMKYQLLRETFISDHVKIVDDNMNLAVDYDSSRFTSPAQDDITMLNDDRILESDLVDEDAKKAVKERRDADVDEMVENESNPDDVDEPDDKNIIEDDPTDDPDWEETENSINEGSGNQNIEEALKTKATPREIEDDEESNSCK